MLIPNLTMASDFWLVVEPAVVVAPEAEVAPLPDVPELPAPELPLVELLGVVVPPPL